MAESQERKRDEPVGSNYFVAQRLLCFVVDRIDAKCSSSGQMRLREPRNVSEHELSGLLSFIVWITVSALHKLFLCRKAKMALFAATKKDA